jgi:eukaryotic-like serine/threonine-protein kinase
MSEGTAEPTRIGNYEVVREAGRTATAFLYEALEPTQRRIVTVAATVDPVAKDEARVREFWDEAMKLAELRHANIARVLDRGRDGDRLFLVEERVAGTPLDEISRRRRFSLAETLTVWKALRDAVEAAHQRGIVHHDLTPSQVVVSDDLATVKLRGFGMRHTQRRHDGATVATTRTVFSGLSYMSPEQAKNMGFADVRSNVYSLGVILYELLTGRVPRGKVSLPSQLNSEVPPQLDPLVLKCIATRPEERYTDVADLKRKFAVVEDQLRLGLLHELQGLQRSTAKVFRRQDNPEISTQIDVPRPDVEKRPGGTNPMLIVAIVVGALVVLAVVAFLLMR